MGSEGLGFGIFNLYQVDRIDDLDTLYTNIYLKYLQSQVIQELVSRWKSVNASRFSVGV